MKKEALNLIEQYIKNNNGKLYAPIPHPLFEKFSCSHYGRSEIIKDKIRDRKDLKTGLDIGSHWGEMCYTLEEMGIKMTAIEKNKSYYYVLTELKNDLKRSFDTIHDDIFLLKEIKYDIILSLNIFHHFIKYEKTYNNWIKMLNRLECKIMFFQAHDFNEGQMKGSYRNFKANDFVNVILENSCLNNSELILEGKRPIFMLTKWD